MDLAQYVIGVDVWQGSLDIDEAALKAGGVKFIWIRMNNNYGQPVADANFTNQWAQAVNIPRAAYYVVSPQYSSAQHAAFILANKPADLRLISLDVELAGGTPATYSLLLKQLISLLRNSGLNVVVYTGGGYKALCSPWPTDVDYWWAAYPYVMYPTTTQTITWEALKAKVASLAWLGEVAPAHIMCWQCSGDRLILPGTAGRVMDINVMPRADFVKYFAPAPVPVTPPPPAEPTDAEKLAILWGEYKKTHTVYLPLVNK